MADQRFVVDRQLWRGVAKLAIYGFVIGLVVLLGGRLLGGHPSVLISLGLPTVIGALLQMLLLTVNENTLSEAEPAPPIESTPLPIVRLRQLERRLQGASTDGSKFDWNIRPILLDLVADRLRYKYAVNLRASPEQARTILGEQLWLDLNSPQNAPGSGMSLARLRAMVAAIEAL